MRRRITWGIVAFILGAYAILPDPFPIVIDDIIAGLGSASIILKMVMQKNMA